MTRPIVLVSITVWLGVVSALALKEAADRPDLHVAALLVVLAVVLGANFLRFVLWGMVYRRHPVSITYPLGATIFPLMLAIDHLRYDEPAPAHKVIASLMIMAGVAVLSAGGRRDHETGSDHAQGT